MSSQYGQDSLVIELLGGKRNGFFIDSGAADGITFSNTRLLEDSFGWSGICVEPNDSLFKMLVRNRRCICLNCCIYNEEGNVEFLESAKMLGGILNEYDPAHLQFAKSTFQLTDNKQGKPTTVIKPARTIRSILRDCGAPQTIDYWSLDTEGSELSILRSFPFDEYALRILTVEHNRFPVKREIREFLEPLGFRLARELAIDDCYVKDVGAPDQFWRSSVWKFHRNLRR